MSSRPRLGGGGSRWDGHLETDTRSGTSSQPLPAPRVPALTVIAHPDPERWGERAALAELLEGGTVRLSRLAPGFAPPGGGVPRPLADPRLSRRPLALYPAGDGGLRLDAGDGATLVERVGRALTGVSSIASAELDDGVPLLLGRRVLLLLHRLGAPSPRPPDFGLVGESESLVEVRREIQRVAARPFPVLLRGESGTGKELVARAIHDASPRRGGPLLRVNVGAIPPPLAAAELFGAARGAYTGAGEARDGFFQRARGGTLLLDEIGEAPPEVQGLLLRAVDSGEVQPVGSSRIERSDARLLFATDADLEGAVAAGAFRSPLLHRLAAYEIVLPPLRRRREDFGRLLRHFLRRELAEVGEEWRFADCGPHGRPWLPAPLVDRLLACSWSGNVRQLRNVARRLVTAARERPDGALEAVVEDLLARLPGAGAAAVGGPEPAPPAGYRRPAEVSDEELVAALRRNRWRMAAAAGELGVSRTTLYALVDRCPAVRKAADLGRDELETLLGRHGDDLAAIAGALEVSERGLRLRLRALGLR